MKKLNEGQMGLLVWGNSGEVANWLYVVVLNDYDDRTEFKREDGVRYLHVWNSSKTKEKKIIGNQSLDSSLQILKVDGEPVYSKRSWFGLGEYTFQPK